jgi:hypothetical protein
MSRNVSVVLALAALLAAQPARSVSFSAGSHLGVFYIRSDQADAGTTTVVAWPANAFTYQPGLRLALGDARHAHELYFDSGLLLMDEAGSTVGMFSALGGYQHTFWARRRDAPFVNVGLGLYREGGATRSATSTAFGGGVGLRHIVGDMHGAVRIEARWDRIRGSAEFGRPRLDTIGLRLGFDLWS